MVDNNRKENRPDSDFLQEEWKQVEKNLLQSHEWDKQIRVIEINEPPKK